GVLLMDKIHRLEAQLFADLANIADLRPLSQGKCLVLSERIQLISKEPFVLLDYVHKEARSWITDLLDKGILQIHSKVLRMMFRDGVLMETWNPGEGALQKLLVLFRLDPFPFARCAVESCRRIFVREQRKKQYCSAACTRKMVEVRRYERVKA